MLQDILTADLIALQQRCSDWQDAVRQGGAMLLRRNFITEEYIEAIINNHQNMGAYMVIAPGIMLAHARPENGSRSNAVSLLTLAEPIEFGSSINDPVKLVITLATADYQSHLAMLEDLMAFLSEGELVAAVMDSGNVEAVINCISKVKKEEEI